MERLEYDRYGGPEVVALRTYTLARPQGNEVRIRVVDYVNGSKVVILYDASVGNKSYTELLAEEVAISVHYRANFE